MIFATIFMVAFFIFEAVKGQYTLSHFAVLQFLRVVLASPCCCNSLSHFAVLQLMKIVQDVHIRCNSLSHFAVLQS